MFGDFGVYNRLEELGDWSVVFLKGRDPLLQGLAAGLVEDDTLDGPPLLKHLSDKWLHSEIFETGSS